MTVVDGVEGPTHHPQPHPRCAQCWCPGCSGQCGASPAPSGRRGPARGGRGPVAAASWRTPSRSGRAYFCEVPRNDHVTPRRNAKASRAMTPNVHGGSGSSRSGLLGGSEGDGHRHAGQPSASAVHRCRPQPCARAGCRAPAACGRTGGAQDTPSSFSGFACAARHPGTRKALRPSGIDAGGRRRSGAGKAGRTDNGTPPPPGDRPGRGLCDRGRTRATAQVPRPTA